MFVPMPKELYLYSGIYSFTAEAFIAAMEEAKNEDIVLRVNSSGGSVFAAYGMIAKIKEHQGKVTAKVDGAAFSMAADLLLFVDSVEATDVSRILIHRANMFVESEQDKQELASINSDLKAKLKQKVDGDKFKEVTGYTIDEVFDSEDVIDITLTAKQAKKLGIVDKIVNLTTSEMRAAAQGMFGVAAKHEEKPKVNNMNIEKLKAEHPEVYAQICKEAVAQERDRVGAWMAFVEVDPKAVSEGVKAGEKITQTEQVELMRKEFSATALKDIEKESSETTETEEEKDKTEKQKEIDEFLTASHKGLGLKAE